MDYNFDAMTMAKHISGAIPYQTFSTYYEKDMDFAPFLEFHAYLEKTFPLVHARLSREIVGKAGLLYHWKGNGNSGLDPVLLMAHQDVVPAGDESAWIYPPFEGVIADGKVWGRGSTDCKGFMIAQLEAVESLLAQGFTPSCDIYLSYGYNEEVMGGDACAAKAAADLFLSRGIRFGCVIDEGSSVRDGKSVGVAGLVCAIGIAEKGTADYRLTCRGQGGHSSVPGKNSALVQLSRAIVAVEEHPFPFRITPAVRLQYETLAPRMADLQPEKARLFADLEENWDALLPIIEADAKLQALFSTTSVTTMAQGSNQSNVLPAQASAVVNCRLLDGDDCEEILDRLRSIVPEGCEVTMLKGQNPSPCSKIDGAGYRAITNTLLEMYPDAAVYPDCVLGGTDSRRLYAVSDYVYRFGAYRKGTASSNVHNVNEFAEISTLPSGAEFFARFLVRYSEL